MVETLLIIMHKVKNLKIYINIKFTLQVLAWWFVGHSSVVNCGEVVKYLCTRHLMMLVISVTKCYNTIRHYHSNTMGMTHI